jgi:hypothetical protein
VGWAQGVRDSQLTDVQILVGAAARQVTEQELARKVAWRRDARGVPVTFMEPISQLHKKGTREREGKLHTPRHSDLIANSPNRSCRWARDLRTDYDTLRKRDSVNEGENVEEHKGQKGRHDGDR